MIQLKEKQQIFSFIHMLAVWTEKILEHKYFVNTKTEIKHFWEFSLLMLYVFVVFNIITNMLHYL